MSSTPDNHISTPAGLATHYRDYLRVLNSGYLQYLTHHVAPRVIHNGRKMNPSEYAKLIRPGATFVADSVVADIGQRAVAARLSIEYKTKEGENGHGQSRLHRVKEHVFYSFDEEWRIVRVWSMIEEV